MRQARTRSLAAARITVIDGDVTYPIGGEGQPRKPEPRTRPMLLEGAEALELYLAQIQCNLVALAKQIALLQAALARRTELLREIAECRRRRGGANSN